MSTASRFPAIPEIRTDLGDGWTLVSSPLVGDEGDDPEDWRFRIEGPHGIVATVPYRDRYSALATLGIRRKRNLGPRAKPGPKPGTALPLLEVAAEVWRLCDGEGGPTQVQTATALGVDVATVRRALPDGVHWRPWVDAIAELRVWTIAHADPRRDLRSG
jgi:hypothetical protein